MQTLLEASNIQEESEENMYAEKISDLSPCKYPLRNTHFYMNLEKEDGSHISNYSTKDWLLLGMKYKIYEENTELFFIQRKWSDLSENRKNFWKLGDQVLWDKSYQLGASDKKIQIHIDNSHE